jgi:hypothetical protein
MPPIQQRNRRYNEYGYARRVTALVAGSGGNVLSCCNGTVNDRQAVVALSNPEGLVDLLLPLARSELAEHPPTKLGAEANT